MRDIIFSSDGALMTFPTRIAIICKNRPTPQDLKRGRKTTLIVAPLALLEQWALEIDTKTNLALKSLVYHGSRKVRSMKELKEYDIVLTTFAVRFRSY